jgi:Holliday junction resolvasome RuvABC DNA-binding subunit
MCTLLCEQVPEGALLFLHLRFEAIVIIVRVLLLEYHHVLYGFTSKARRELCLSCN